MTTRQTGLSVPGSAAAGRAGVLDAAGPHIQRSGADQPLAPPAAVCVLVPTRNEAGNVAPLLARLGPVLARMNGEVLFVDDSDDQTPAAVAAAATNSAVPVRLLHRAADERVGGLGGAVQAGLATSTATWTVVMDGDLQHPPEQVPDLIAAAERGADVVVATRYDGSGSAAGLSSRFRGLVSHGATGVARLLFPRALAGVSDPMSGFFAVRTAAVDPGELRPRGFKILLELLVRNPGLRVAEVPFTFAERHDGESKACGREGIRYLRQLAGLRMATSPQAARLLRFALVGGTGVVVNLLVLALLLRTHVGVLAGGSHAASAIVATQVAIGWNFALTERWVFPGRPGNWARRLFPFWALNCAALLAQLPLASRVQPLLGGSYLLATAAALAVLILARFAVCDRLLYRAARRRDVTAGRTFSVVRAWLSVRSRAGQAFGALGAPGAFGPGWLRLAAVILAVGTIAGLYMYRTAMIIALMLATAAFNMTVAALEARWRLYVWRTPETAGQLDWPRPVDAKAARLNFSVIVPARDEAAVIGATLEGLARQDHPFVEIIVSLCDDDTATIDAARRAARHHPSIRVIAGHYDRPSKAQQLNTALSVSTADVVGVIDAEDDVAPALLRHVEALFAKSGADVVQGGVQLMNLGEGIGKWFQVHNVLEYFFWFTSRMAYQADVGFVPLGGNTVFVYRDLLEQAGGWPDTLTEDCALGVVLAAEHGAKVAAAYSAELVTREESPPTIFSKKLGSLFWQRDRWVRGFVTELAGGKWLKLPTLRRRALAGYFLANPLLQALCAVLLPFAAVTAVLVKAPVGLTLLMFTPLLPLGITAASQLVGLRQFTRSYQLKARAWHYASVLFLAPLYQLILGAAAAVAVYKYGRGDIRWYKTGRAAEHRAPRVAWLAQEEMAA